MIPPKVALFLNFIAITLSSLLALGYSVFAHAGLPSPETLFACGLLLQAVLNGFLHAYSAPIAGPLVRDQKETS